jgi:hypothetical protein
MRSRWLFTAVLALVGATAHASTFLALTREELVAGSAAVVDARVTEVRSFWNEAHTVILTEATVRVDQVFVGEAPAYLTVRTFGGRVGRVRVEAQGFPTFDAGQRLLLFLYREPADGSVRVQGYRLGEYRIETGADGVDMAVPMADAGMTFLRKDGKAYELPHAQRLDELVRGVREDAARVGTSGRAVR